MSRTLRFWREAVLMSWGQPVISAVAVLLIATVCVSVMLTAGRTQASEAQVLSSINTPTARTVVIRADGAGVTTNALRSIRRIDGIAWSAAFGPAVDVSNEGLPGGSRVALRKAYGLAALRSAPAHGVKGISASAFVTDAAASRLGLTEPSGAVVSVDDGRVYPIAGRVDDLPANLSFINPVVLLPSRLNGQPATVAIIVVVVRNLSSVPAVTDGIEADLSPTDPGKVTVSTSSALVHLNTLVARQLSLSTRALLSTILLVVGVLETVALTSLVLIRRRDFGRRRALGASRSLIARLVLAQSAVLAAAGVVAGTAIADGYLQTQREAAPEVSYQIAVGVIAFLLALVATILPLVLALTRQPSQELRVA